MKHARNDYNGRIVDLAAPKFQELRAHIEEAITIGDVSLLAKMDIDKLIPPVHESDTEIHPVGEDEPVFLLRAKDKCAPATVEAWANLANFAGANWRMTMIAIEHSQSMRDWQNENGDQTPDMPEQKLQQER